VVAHSGNEDATETVQLDAGRLPDGQYGMIRSEWPEKKNVAPDIVGKHLNPQFSQEFSTGRINPLPDTIANFAGPKYGLPGYKESHNWEVPEINIFSPLIFNWKFYASMYGLENATRTQVRENWHKYIKDATYPNCRQGHFLFSLDKYIEKETPDIKAKIGNSCMKALTEFLSVGLFEGDHGRTFCDVRSPPPKSEIAFNAIRGLSFGTFPCAITEKYVLTFWIRFDFAGTNEYNRNLFHIGSEMKAYPKSPAIYQYPSSMTAPSTRLAFVISSTEDNDFGCDPEEQPEVGKWMFVALSVQRQAMQVYYNAKKVCSAKTKGKIIIPERSEDPAINQQTFFVSDPWHKAAMARIEQMLYYANYEHTGPSGLITEKALEAMAAHSPPDDAEVPGAPKEDRGFFASMASLHYPLDHLRPEKEKQRSRQTARTIRTKAKEVAGKQRATRTGTP
jgi:hypothetical protein